MDVLDEKLDELASRLGATPHRALTAIEQRARRVRKARWVTRWGASALVVITALGVVVALREPSGRRIETPPATVPTPTTGPPPPTPDDAITQQQPSFADQVRQIETWYHDWPAEAPGGRPILAAEYTFCDYRARPDLMPFNHVTPGDQIAGRVESRFSSYSRLGDPLTESRIVDGCLYRPDRYPGNHPRNIPVETPASELPPHVLCSTDQPQHKPSDRPPPIDVVLKPVVVFEGTTCTEAGFLDAPPDFVEDLDRQRRVEIELRGVPRTCPSGADAVAWVRHIIELRLGVVWDVGGPWDVATSGRPTSTCVRPHFVDWDRRQVGYLTFDKQS